MTRSKLKVFAFWIILTLAVGGLAGFIIRDGVDVYTQDVIKPPLSPPQVVFPVVWSVLYVLMGAAAAFVWLTGPSDDRTKAIWIYCIQLAFNFFWSIIFFNFKNYGFAFLWLCVLWLLILWTSLLFARCDKKAGYMLLPYLMWVAFAGYLNFGVWAINC